MTRDKSSWVAVLAASTLLLTTATAILPNQTLPDCVAQKYDNIADKGKFWADSGIEGFADAYIMANGDHSNWTQDLYMELFPKDNLHTQMECMTAGASCSIPQNCEDFNAIGKGGLFYLYQSLSAFQGYVTRMRALFVEEAFMTALSVDEIATDMKLDKVESKDKFDIFAILGAALSMAKIGTIGNPIAGGAVTFLSGFVGVMGKVTEPEKPAQLGNAGKVAMNDLIKSMTNEATHQIDQILAAVFGMQGHKQDDIPEVMRIGDSKNPCVQVFGGGGWLQDQPNNGLPEWAGEIGKQMKQAIYWSTANKLKGIQVIIRDDLKQDKCIAKNNGWDKDKNRCYDMMLWNNKTQGESKRYFGGATDLIGLFQKYEMDPAATMRNSAECWEANDGATHSPEPWAKIGEDVGKLPKCFFAATVHKGTYNSKRRGINLDPDYVGSLADRKKGEDMLWPR